MALHVDIRKHMGDFHLDVIFDTHKECMGILGASGCGKSMTLKCIAGIETPDEGSIVLNDKVLFDSDKRINLPPQKRHVGYLFQNYALFPHMTVEENIGIGLPGRKRDKKDKVQAEISRFQLQGLENRYPGQLSGGQQQRVAFARILLYEPDIIMLDEPFSALDGFLKDVLQMEMLEMIAQYTGDVLLVSHGRDEIFKFCDKMTLISQGKGILTGNTKDIFENPIKMEAARLTGCKNISAIEKINEYELYATDWDIHLNTKVAIEEGIRYVGIRGHHLVPSIDGREENAVPVLDAGYAETPFERQYLFRNADNDRSERIWWMVKKEGFSTCETDELPPYMVFPKEHLLLLR